MVITGLHKLSLIDYPNLLSAVLFVKGCNFRCPYCHNPELVEPPPSLRAIDESELFNFLRNRERLLDGIVISGGEPTIYRDLPDFMERIKRLGYCLKLDTNGSMPEMLTYLIKKHLVDHIAMDVKGPLAKYGLIAGTDVDLQEIKKSIEIIKNARISYEFRMTILPRLHSGRDIKEIGHLVSGARCFTLTNFSPGKTLNPDFSHERSFTNEEIARFKKIMSNYVKECRISP